jgi:hypothetical protein
MIPFSLHPAPVFLGGFAGALFMCTRYCGFIGTAESKDTCNISNILKFRNICDNQEKSLKRLDW